MLKKIVNVLLSTFVFVTIAAFAQDPNDSKQLVVGKLNGALDKLVWKQQNFLGTGGRGTKGINLVEMGDPNRKGLYVMLIQIMPDSYIALHTHSAQEHLVVLRGEIRLAASNKLTSKHKKCARKLNNCKEYQLISHKYATIPAGMPHYLYNAKLSKLPAIILVYFKTPFEMTYVDPKDNPQGKNKQVKI